MIKYKLTCKKCDNLFDSWFPSSKEYQKFIKNNFEYVGENFAYEARSIHYNNKKKTKGIYGNATTEEVKELKEEGINTEIIPWVNEKDN